LKKNEGMITVKFKPQRKYPIEIKKKTIILTGKLGPCMVSALTGIPESSLRFNHLISLKRIHKLLKIKRVNGIAVYRV